MECSKQAVKYLSQDEVFKTSSQVSQPERSVQNKQSSISAGMECSKQAVNCLSQNGVFKTCRQLSQLEFGGAPQASSQSHTQLQVKLAVDYISPH